MTQTLTQLLRYGIVGLASNALGYLLYLGLTFMGVGPKLAMSLLYGVGVIQTFVFNKKWSFRFEGAATPALIRYVTVYGAGYVVQFVGLMVLVDQVGLPHQWVMGGLILFVAVLLFLSQKFWVFRQTSVADTGAAR